MKAHYSKSFISIIGVAVIITLFLGIAFELDVCYNWERSLYDSVVIKDVFHFKEWMASNKKASSSLNYAVIFSSSLKSMEANYNMGWPWRRSVYGDLSLFLKEAGAKWVVYDFLFSEKSVYQVTQKPPYREENDDLIFSNKLKQAGNSIVGFNTTGKWNSLRLSNGTRDLYLDGKIIPVLIKNPSFTIKSFENVVFPVQKIIPSITGMGFVTIDPDKDGIYREADLLIEHQGKLYPSLALSAAIQSINPKSLKIEGGFLELDDVKIPLNAEGKVKIKYYGDSNVYQDFNFYHLIEFYDQLKAAYQAAPKEMRVLSLNQILEDEKLFKTLFQSQKKEIPVLKKAVLKNGKVIQPALQYQPGIFKEKIFMVCSVAPGLLDIRPNPFSRTEPGAQIHMSVLDNLLQNDFLKTADKNWLKGLVLFFISLGIGILFKKTSFFVSLLVSIVLMISSLIISSFLYYQANLVLYFLCFNTCILISFFSFLIMEYYSEFKQKKFIQSAFGYYLSPTIIEVLMNEPAKLKLGGEKKDMTAFFSDLEGFSAISEKLSPEELVHLLNEYLSEMCRIISENDGIVDKFEGDAIVAFWGAPVDHGNHAEQAAAAAVKMQKKIIELRSKWREEKRPELKMRIGINSGPMVVGNMGAEHRMDYTIVGDSVNLASRLEGANKFYGTYTMISQSTYELIKNRFATRYLDLVRVVGKKEPVKIYELLDEKGNIGQKEKEAYAVYQQGIEMYLEMNFQEALQCFEKVLFLLPEDKPTQLYISRCKEYLKNPPVSDWDRVENFTSKG